MAEEVAISIKMVHLVTSPIQRKGTSIRTAMDGISTMDMRNSLSMGSIPSRTWDNSQERIMSSHSSRT